MARYQLFRTSPALSGQVRLDIILNKNSDQNILGDEIHVVPINDNIDFNESNKRNTLRYSHLENIKNLYREIGPSFFSTDGEYSGQSWLFQDKVKKDPYSHMYFAGPRRMRYSRYGKQFSYMIPIWISEETDMTKFRFICHIGMYDGDNNFNNIMSSFKLSDELNKYFNEYLGNTSNGTPISEDLLNIDFQKMESYVQGVQADTGQYMTRDTSYIFGFLLNRERPMLETDSNILDLFRQNNIIAQQLLNLNFVFNLEDISGSWPEYWLYNRQIGFWIDVQYDGESLEYKDLYTNYEFIPKYDLNNEVYRTGKNILDFMEDYNCEDTVCSNKFVQPVFHWTLVNNPDYIFNLYSGCAPIIGNENGKDLILEGGTFNWVDISLNNADPYKRNWQWIKCFDFSNTPNYSSIMTNPQVFENPSLKYTQIRFEKNMVAINNNIFNQFYDDADKKNCIVDFESAKNSNKKIWLAAAIRDFASDSDYIQNPDYEIKVYTESQTGEEIKDILVLILAKEIDNLLLYNICTSESFISAIDDINSNSDEVNNIIKSFLRYLIGCPTTDESEHREKNMWDRWIRPNKIEFNQGLEIYKPDKTYLGQKVQEFQYTNIDYFTNAVRTINHNRSIQNKSRYYSYMYRYSGNLVPFFMDPVKDEAHPLYNNFYRYYQWDNDKIDIMRNCAVLKNNKIPMSHPSILLGTESRENETLKITYFPWVLDGEINNAGFYDEEWNRDVIWGKHSLVWNLPVEITFNLPATREESYENIKNRIWMGLVNALRGMVTSDDCPLADVMVGEDGQVTEEMKYFIMMNYEMVQNFEYAAIDNINNIIYTITFKLR